MCVAFMEGRMASSFSGPGMNLGNLWRLSAAKARSISPENFKGEKGSGGMATEGTGARRARDLGHGWKVLPSVGIAPGATYDLAHIVKSGAIHSIWISGTLAHDHPRQPILHIYWEDVKEQLS